MVHLRMGLTEVVVDPRLIECDVLCFSEVDVDDTTGFRRERIAFVEIFLADLDRVVCVGELKCHRVTGLDSEVPWCEFEIVWTAGVVSRSDRVRVRPNHRRGKEKEGKHA